MDLAELHTMLGSIMSCPATIKTIRLSGCLCRLSIIFFYGGAGGRGRGGTIEKKNTGLSIMS